MRRTALPAIAVLALLGGCGGEPEQAAGGADPAAPAAPAAAPTPAETQALLASLPAPYSSADPAAGKRVFARCRACHTVTPDGRHMTGPNLHGVFGRAAGSKEGYNYSEALQAAEFTWDGSHLDAWLADPRGYLPGNKMAFAGVRDAKERTDLIAWLMIETGAAQAG